MSRRKRAQAAEIDIDSLTPHPAAAWFPMLADAELQALADDIREHGQRVPILIYLDRIIDGRNRLAACRLAGVKPLVQEITTADVGADREPWSYTSAELAAMAEETTPEQWNAIVDAAIERYIVSTNLHRRHLTESQRGMIAARMANRAQGQTGTSAGLTQGQAAEQLQVSERTVRDAKLVQREAPELVQEIDAGRLTVKAAAATVRTRSITPKPTTTQEAAPTIALPAAARDRITDIKAQLQAGGTVLEQSALIAEAVRIHADHADACPLDVAMSDAFNVARQWAPRLTPTERQLLAVRFAGAMGVSP